MKAGLAAVLLILPACTSRSEPSSTVWAVSEIEVAGQHVSVQVADTQQKRYQGLRNVEELPPGIDGMLFVYGSPTPATFGMRDTLIPLDIWWFDANGMLVGSGEMEPCETEPCPAYRSPGLIMWVLETPLGEWDFDPGSPLTVETG